MSGDTTSITSTGTLNEQLSYDAQQRLLQVTLGSPITSTIVIAYNTFGQRASYTVTPAGAGSPSLHQSFKYQGDQLAQVAYTGTSINPVGASGHPSTPSASWSRSARYGSTSARVATCSLRPSIARSWRSAVRAGTG